MDLVSSSMDHVPLQPLPQGFVCGERLTHDAQMYYEAQIRELREELMACKAQERDMSDLVCELEKRVQESVHQAKTANGTADAEQGVPLLFELSESFINGGAIVGQVCDLLFCTLLAC
jgi:hypothetical protein